MGKIQEITQGWINSLKESLGVLPDSIKVLAEKRLEICSACPMNTDGVCDPKKSLPAVQDFTYNTLFGSFEYRTKGTEYTGCNCPLSKKCLSPITCCPIGSWLDVDQEKLKENGSRTQD